MHRQAVGRTYNENILLDRVVQTIERHRMFTAGDRVAVAVSGGADSVCLLHVLVALRERWNLTLSVLHVNHNLRGEASRGDAGFVRDLASALQLEFTQQDLNLFNVPGNLEQAARNGRNAFFEDHIAAGRATRIALGHTRSDQAETVLFRFLRGSGTTGLAAIRPVTADGIVRPLLEIERPEILRFLRDRIIPWREDATNATLDFARNRIRHGLLPQLRREWNPALTETLSHTADLSLAEEAYWEGEIDRLAALHLRCHGPDVLVSAAALTSLPLAVARRLVRHAIHLATIHPATIQRATIQRANGCARAAEFRHVAAVLDLAGRAEGTGRTQIPGLEVRRSFDWLRLGPLERTAGYRLRPPVPGIIRIPGTDSVISLELLENSETIRSPDYVYTDEMGCLDWNRLSGPLELRNWQPGDQYQPKGVPAARKIKALFQQARIPVWERAQWPVLTDAESIVWARRFGTASAVTAGAGSLKVLAIGELKA